MCVGVRGDFSNVFVCFEHELTGVYVNAIIAQLFIKIISYFICMHSVLPH